MSDRYKKDDNFWLTFSHEAAHVFAPLEEEDFVDDDIGKDMLEDETNGFAANLCSVICGMSAYGAGAVATG